MVLSSSSLLTKKQTNPSNKYVIEVMMIPHINIKNTWQFRFYNSRKKKDIKGHFSGLIWKFNLNYSLWKRELPESTFNFRVYRSWKQRNYKVRICLPVVSLLNCVTYVLTCQRVLRASVLTYQRALRAFVFPCLRANVFCVHTCSHANVSCVLTCSRASVPCVPVWSRAIISNNNKRNDKRFNNRGYSLFFLMGIFLKHLWLIPNILKWQDCKIFTKVVPSQTPSRSSHRRCSVKRVFLKICEISQENICVGVSYK